MCPATQSRTVRQHQNYCLCTNFQTLEPNSGWNDNTLWGVYIQGLVEELKDELAAQEEMPNLEMFVNLTIHLDNHLRERQRKRARLHREVSPMASARLSGAAAEPPTRTHVAPPEVAASEPMQLLTSGSSPCFSPVHLMLPGMLLWPNHTISLSFLVDSIADDSFIDQDLVMQASISH